MDLWQFTPLHEAASKNRVEVCSLLLSHGADPTLLNCHSKSSVDMAPTPELKERLTCECAAGLMETPSTASSDERNLCPSSSLTVHQWVDARGGSAWR